MAKTCRAKKSNYLSTRRVIGAIVLLLIGENSMAQLPQTPNIPSNSEVILTLLSEFNFSPREVFYNKDLISKSKIQSMSETYSILGYASMATEDRTVKLWSLHDVDGYVASISVVFLDNINDVAEAVAVTFNGYSIPITDMALSKHPGADLVIQFPGSLNYIGLSTGNAFLDVSGKRGFDARPYAQALLAILHEQAR